ncbi:MAG: class I SAM-dependent methyltransferase [Bacteroidota bacterium]
MDQQSIWENRTLHWSVQDVQNMYKKPAIFQTELAELINQLLISEPMKIMEIGCEAGGTTYLIKNKGVEKTLLDYNKQVIALLESTYKEMGLSAVFSTADMYNMPFADNTYDLVFNAGVVEHYEYEERVKLFKEYSRVVKPGGYMVIAIPNHYSFPYRLAYRIYEITGKWMFPKELKIFDFKKEADELKTIAQIERKIISKGSVFNWLNFFKPLKQTMIFLDKFFKFEGYLTVIIFKKL